MLTGEAFPRTAEHAAQFLGAAAVRAEIPFGVAQGRLSLRLKNGSAWDDAGKIVACLPRNLRNFSLPSVV
jgi:hypothetical protein